MSSNTIYKPTWLYIKQHNQTGLKYFGKTTRDDIDRYKGSGRYWTRHLKKHGSEVTTIWKHLYTDKDTLVEEALAFSIAHNIVNAVNGNGKKIWANEKVENGLDGGANTPESMRKMVETKRKVGNINSNSPKAIQKKLETRLKNGTWYSWTQESAVKSRSTKVKNGTLSSNTEGSKIKKAITRELNGTCERSPCPHCGKLITKWKNERHLKVVHKL